MTKYLGGRVLVVALLSKDSHKKFCKFHSLSLPVQKLFRGAATFRILCIRKMSLVYDYNFSFWVILIENLSKNSG